MTQTSTSRRCETAPAIFQTTFGIGLGKLSAAAPCGQQDDVEEDIGDADRRDHRRGTRHVAQGRSSACARSATPSAPQNSMTPTRASSSTPTRGKPVRMTRWPIRPSQLQDPHGEERAHHEDVEVGEVDQLDDAVDHGEPEREERVHRAQAHPVDDLLKQDILVCHRIGTRPLVQLDTVSSARRRLRRHADVLVLVRDVVLRIVGSW